MRNGQNKRMRGRNRRGHNPLTRVYESNGPDVKIRGTAHHVAEKYMQLARDAQASGDPVSAESYFQHAEHYFRLIAAAQSQFAQPHQQQQHQQPFTRSDSDQRGDFDDEGDDMGMPEQPTAQPYQGGAPVAHVQRSQTPQPPQPQPQPPLQGYPQQREGNEQRDIGLPAFITGGSAAPAQQGNGFGNEQGDRDGRFGRHRRRRFRPRGPGDFEQRGGGDYEARSERPGEMPAASPAPSTASGEAQPGEGMTPPKPTGQGE